VVEETRKRWWIIRRDQREKVENQKEVVKETKERW